MSPTEPVLNVQQIEKLLPHRYPFLLVDRVIELEPGKRGVGVKCVTANEPNGRFWNNAECVRALESVGAAESRGRRLRKLLDPTRYWRRLRRIGRPEPHWSEGVNRILRDRLLQLAEAA